MMSGEWSFFLMTVKISLGSGTKLASYCLHMLHEHGKHLFGNRSQMTSKYDKNKKVAHKVQKSVDITDVVTTF